jgi:hypothetical protein
MAPCIFYRVESSSSRAKYCDGKGIFAEDTKLMLSFDSNHPQLRPKVKNHLNWNCQVPSPFISVYANKHTAMWEAKRRIEAKHRDVCYFKIDVRRIWRKPCERVEYRNMRKLAKKLQIKIRNRALNNSKHEYIFLHHVPDDAIVNTGYAREVREYFEDCEW